MSSLVVVSGDPGVTTGWAVQKVPCEELLRRGLVGSSRFIQWTSGQFRPGSTSESVDQFLDIARVAYERVADEDDLFVMVVESFTLRMMSMDPELLEPVRFNAILDDRLRGRGGVVVEWQQPSDALTTMTDVRLGLWGLLVKKDPRHARDARRHGLLYFRRWAESSAVRKRSGYEAG